MTKKNRWALLYVVHLIRNLVAVLSGGVGGIMRSGFIVSIALTLLGVYMSLLVGLYFYQRAMIYFPAPHRPNIATANLPAVREVELRAPDGLRLLGWYLSPSSGGRVVVFFHGNAGGIQDRAYRFRAFADAGYGVLMPEYRGYSGNAGTPSESGFLGDADVAMRFLEDQGVAMDRVVVYGESLGTGVAVHVAATHAIAALILEAPFTSLTALASERFPFLPVRLMLKDRFDSLSRITQVRAPLLILHGARDTVVSPALGRELFAKASAPKELWIAEAGGHNDLIAFGVEPAVFDFLSRHLAR
jgi:fermentation-respiration switch protein FrsA (DUF1100 family)